MVLNLIICFLVMIILAFLLDFIHNKISEKKGISYEDSINKAGIPIITLKNGNTKFNFLLDTGSDMSHIDSSVVKYLKDIEYIQKEEISVCTANGIKEGNNQLIKISLKYKQENYFEEFMPLDFSESFDSIKEETGIQLHGILGITFFKKYGYILDFNKMILYTK